MPTPYESWNKWMENVATPELFKEAGFYSLTASAVQRRMWIGDEDAPMWLNLYFLFVAKPGVGKGLTTRAIKSIATSVRHVSRDAAGVPSERPGIQVAADSTTFQKYVLSLTKSPFTFKRPDGKHYIYMANTFILEELTSIFHREAGQLLDLLLALYDCTSYDYQTISRGEDRIVNPCVNLVAGTQPARMDALRKHNILSSGFMSRFIIIHAEKNAKHSSAFFVPRTATERACSAELSAYAEKLSHRYGSITVSPEALAFIDDKWHAIQDGQRINRHPVLDEYYGRWNLHIGKISAAAMLGRDPDASEITLSDARQAHAFLAKAEQVMTVAFGAVGRNVTAAIGDAIVDFIARVGDRGTSWPQIYAAFIKDAEKPELQKLLDELVEEKRIRKDLVDGKVSYKKI